MSGRRTRQTVTVSSDRGVFMISVAAELADMHPQTLRMYEQRGLIEPKRSPKGTRLYSHEDVERLRRIQEMTNDLGLNLAGVEHVLALGAGARPGAPRVDALERRTDGAAGGDAPSRSTPSSASCAARARPLKHTRGIVPSTGCRWPHRRYRPPRPARARFEGAAAAARQLAAPGWLPSGCGR